MAIVDRVDGNLSGKWDDVAQKWVEPPKIIDTLPKKKSFPVGAVFKVFDGEPIADKIAFADNSLVQLTIAGLQDIILSRNAIDRIQGDIDGLLAAGVIKQGPYDRLTALLASWKNELRSV